jgi:HAE1 family hydrophobic/amphiphilic exporter-1
MSPEAGGGLSGVAIRRPIFTTMLMVGLIVLGLFSYRRLAIDQFPAIDLPIVTVQTTFPGASAEGVEREVTRRLEEAFNPVQGVRSITSVSLEGVSQVIVEFELGREVDDAAQDLRSKLEGIRRNLPEDIDPPIVQKLDPAAQPIISLALSSSTLAPVQLTTLADETIRRRLEAVPGVGDVQVSGGAEREVRVNLRPDRLQALGITVPEVTAALARQNLEVPAGRVGRGTSVAPRTGRWRSSMASGRSPSTFSRSRAPTRWPWPTESRRHWRRCRRDCHRARRSAWCATTRPSSATRFATSSTS